MCEANYTALAIEIRKDFKEKFGYDLADEDLTENNEGYEISYQDYDLNRLDAYKRSPLIEVARVENDGRESYIRVFTVLSYEDYFGVN